jgi:uncharacterized protein
VHHREAHAWFADRSDRCFATRALTQLAFVRLSCNPRVSGADITPPQAMQALGELTAHAGHRYWADTPEPLGLPTLDSAALVGHRQVTDAYLLGPAAHQGQVLATLDRGLVSHATALRLQRHIELVNAPLRVREPKARYQAQRTT